MTLTVADLVIVTVIAIGVSTIAGVIALRVARERERRRRRAVLGQVIDACAVSFGERPSL